jgi:hypothetical protein
MASGGLLFTTQHPFLLGGLVEASVSWPASLSETCALTLFARGRVIRMEDGLVAMCIDSHEFRTRAPSAS